MNRHACALWALVPLAACPSLARAEDAPGADIVVTAARGTALKDMDVSATVLSADQIAALHATAPDQVVNKIPGIFTLNQPAAVLHPTGDTFSIRGFSTTTNVNTLVMLDGVPMNDPYFRVVDWNQIAKGQMESIEVIRGGGATSLWGNMAMGGIVNIVSKAPNAGHMDFDVNAGSYKTCSGSATAGVALGRDVVAGISASDTVSDGYNKTPAAYRNPYMAATPSQNTNLSATICATPSADSSLYLRAMWHNLSMQDLVWQGTSNRWQTWRIAFGGEKAVGIGKLSLNGWYGGGGMNTTNSTMVTGSTVPALGMPFWATVGLRAHI